MVRSKNANRSESNEQSEEGDFTIVALFNLPQIINGITRDKVPARLIKIEWNTAFFSQARSNVAKSRYQ